MDRPKQKSFTLKARLIGSALLGATILLAVIPSVLVLWDKWLGNNISLAFIGQFWKNTFPFTRINLPGYFIIICAAFILMLILLLLIKRKNTVEIDKKTETLNLSKTIFKKRNTLLTVINIVLALISAIDIYFFIAIGKIPGFEIFIIASLFLIINMLFLRKNLVKYFLNEKIYLILLSHLSLIALLALIYSKQFNIFYLLPMIANIALLVLLLFSQKRFGLATLLGVCILITQLFSMVFLSNYIEANVIAWIIINILCFAQVIITKSGSKLFWIVSASLISMTLFLNSWFYSAIGDEYAFHEVAKQITEGKQAIDWGNPFSMGVYGQHTMLSSYLQSIFLYLFGDTNFAWRFSSIYFVILSIPLFFCFIRRIANNNIALISAFLLAFSEYLFGFARIGYNNTQALFVECLILISCYGALKNRRMIDFLLLGMASALSFFVYPVALFSLVLIPIYLIFYFKPSKGIIKNLLFCLIPILIFVTPLLFNHYYFSANSQGTFFTNQQLTQGDFISFFVGNIVHSLFGLIYIIKDSHYVSMSYIDLITSSLFMLGIGISLVYVRKSTFCRFAITAFVAMLVLVGGTQQYEYPSTTRMFMLLPFYFVFAGIALFWVGKLLIDWGLNRKLLGALFFILAISIVGLNYYQAYNVALKRNIYFINITIMWYKFVSDDLDPNSILGEKLVFVDTKKYTTSGYVAALKNMEDLYDIPHNDSNQVHLDLTNQKDSIAFEDMLSKKTGIIFPPFLYDDREKDLDWHDLERRLVGYRKYEIKEVNGISKAEVWIGENSASQIRWK